MSRTNIFLADTGVKLAARLSAGFEYLKSSRELRRDSPNGQDVIAFAGSNKYSPHLSISFYFGRTFTVVREMEKKLKWHRMPFHIQQYSAGMKQMDRLNYKGNTDWDANTEEDNSSLVSSLAGVIEQVAYPFFDRFQDIRTARDAFANGDTWCFSHNLCWHQLLKMDLALGEPNHFRAWAVRLDELQHQQANAMLNEFAQHKAMESNQPLHPDALTRAGERRR